MSSDAYRSYVLRVRRSRAVPENVDRPVRIDVEDLLDGGRAVLDGDKARSLAEGLEAALEEARPSTPRPPAE